MTRTWMARGAALAGLLLLGLTAASCSTPEAAAVKSWCFAEPLPACSATAPGGACEVSTALAFYMWNAKCG